MSLLAEIDPNLIPDESLEIAHVAHRRSQLLGEAAAILAFAKINVVQVADVLKQVQELAHEDTTEAKVSLNEDPQEQDDADFSEIIVQLDFKEEVEKSKPKTKIATSKEIRSTAYDQPKTKARLASTSDEKGEWSTDEIKNYLNSIGRHRILTREEEFELGCRLEVGRKAKERLDSDTENELAIDEIRSLNKLIKDAESAKNEFINSNFKLVVSIAKRHQGRGMPFMDIIQEGNLGMMHAVDLFDHHKGFKFSTYATWWIRQYIHRAVHTQADLIKWPEKTHQDIKAYEDMAAELKATGLEVTDDEMAELLEVTPERLRVLKNARITGRNAISIDRPINSDSDNVIGDLIADSKSSDGYEKVDVMQGAGEIISILNGIFDERTVGIIVARFGLLGGEPENLENIAPKFKITRERVRQIESKAVLILQHPIVYQYISSLDRNGTQEWKEQAACVDEDVEIVTNGMGVPRGRPAKNAIEAIEEHRNYYKNICAGCSIRSECEQIGRSLKANRGIWGGVVATTREKIK